MQEQGVARLGSRSLGCCLAILLAACGQSAPPDGSVEAGLEAGPANDGGGVPFDAGLSCTGVPSLCTDRSNATCVSGCLHTPCAGTAAACDTFTTDTTCRRQSGCAWSGARCFGSPSGCDTRTTLAACNLQEGCSVGDDARCGGRPYPCDMTPLDLCDSVPGCEITGYPDELADAGMPTDGGPANPECNTMSGIECDGNWFGRCPTACADEECCSPQNGRFRCMPRVDGRCPAADLSIDATRITGEYYTEFRQFEESDCALVERCVTQAGTRRLLRFDTWTPNTGDADMFLGNPMQNTTGNFEFSACHNHYHFNSYAEYELLDMSGNVVATGHKQAFCLLDFYEYPRGRDFVAGERERYTCQFQGIQRGWQDVYDSSLDCQWVDVTDVPAGRYQLHISLNTERILNESNYENNEVTVPVVIEDPPADVDVTQACTGNEEGITRNCGWTRVGDYECDPGAEVPFVAAGCSARAMLGSCTGDPMMRVCDSAHDPECTTRWIISQSDDSGVGNGRCGQGGDCCPFTNFRCPASGHYTVFSAPYRSTDSATCNVTTGQGRMP